MFAGGLVDEVKGLLGKMSSEAQQGVGYKEVVGYLERQYSLEDAAEKVRRGTRKLAKHQMTWLRRFHDLHWLPGDNENLVEEAIQLVKNWREKKSEVRL